jgi:endonuclease/exonuclease/phosphatase family metal-dependent hydrolase
VAAELTLASYNIHFGFGRRFAHYPPFSALDAARELDADVLVLQESWQPDGGESQHDAIARELGYVAHSVALARAVVDPQPAVVGRADAPVPAGDTPAGHGTWNLAVLSRLPVQRTSTTPLPQLRFDPPNRAVLQVDVLVDAIPLAVCGTHLAHLDRGVLLRRGALRAALPSADTAALLVGDMNMWSPFISFMAPPGFTRTGRGRTFSSTYPHSRIDHLLVTPSVEVLHTEVVRDLGSDHRPIRARLRLR